MTVAYKEGRQEVISAVTEFEYSDLTSGAAYNAIQLPANAVLLRGTYWVVTAFNSGTSDAGVLAFNGLTLVTDSDAQAAVRTEFSMPTTSNPGLVVVTTPTNITYTWTGAGTAATAGKVRVEAEYVVLGRAAFTQG